MVSVVKFPVCDIVKQRGKLHHEHVCIFLLSYLGRNLPHLVDVPLVMARAFPAEFFLYMIRGLLNNLLLFFCSVRHLDLIYSNYIVEVLIIFYKQFAVYVFSLL